MAFAQRLLQWGVQLAGGHVAVVEVTIHKIAVHLNHLFNQCPMGIVYRAKIAVPFTVVKTIHHFAGVGIGQVQGQAFLAKSLLDLFQ